MRDFASELMTAEGPGPEPGLLETAHDCSCRYWERWEDFAWLGGLLDFPGIRRGDGGGCSDPVKHRAVFHHYTETGISTTEEEAI